METQKLTWWKKKRKEESEEEDQGQLEDVAAP